MKLETITRRHGMMKLSRDLGVSYSHLFRCLQFMNGDSVKGRKPGKRIESIIRMEYPELIQKGE